jgi:hypothetical protein
VSVAALAQVLSWSVRAAAGRARAYLCTELARAVFHTRGILVELRAVRRVERGALGGTAGQLAAVHDHDRPFLASSSCWISQIDHFSTCGCR